VAITRPGYGPNGETVVFDSEDAINLYNYKHGLPGEYFPKPKEVPKSPYPAGKFSGLMFGDYYWYDKWHQDQISTTNTNGVQSQQGFWLRRIYHIPDLQFSEKFTTRFRLGVEQQRRPFAGGNLNSYVKDVHSSGPRQAGLTRHPAEPHLRLASRASGACAHREDPGRPLPHRLSRDFGLTLGGPSAS
jgi:hypothetical protein